jgi:hypothetical protein
MSLPSFILSSTTFPVKHTSILFDTISFEFLLAPHLDVSAFYRVIYVLIVGFLSTIIAINQNMERLVDAVDELRQKLPH